MTWLLLAVAFGAGTWFTWVAWIAPGLRKRGGGEVVFEKGSEAERVASALSRAMRPSPHSYDIVDGKLIPKPTKWVVGAACEDCNKAWQVDSMHVACCDECGGSVYSRNMRVRGDEILEVKEQ